MTTRHAHNLVARTADEMAEALYEQYAKDNAFYKVFGGKKGRAMFVRRVAPQLLERARETLTSMLSMDYSDAAKEEIYDALIKDRSLIRGRGLIHQPPPLPH